MSAEADPQPPFGIERSRCLNRSMDRCCKGAPDLCRRDLLWKRVAQRGLGQQVECSKPVSDGAADRGKRTIRPDESLLDGCITLRALLNVRDQFLPGRVLVRAGAE